MNPTTADIEAALRAALPDAPSADLARLADLLRDALRGPPPATSSGAGGGAGQAAQGTVTLDRPLAALVRRLDGSELRVGGALIGIGAGAQTGDITVGGDLVGGNSYKVTLNLPPPAPPWQFWLLLTVGLVSLALITAVALRLWAPTDAATQAAVTTTPPAPDWADAPLALALPPEVELLVAASPACTGMVDASALNRMLERVDLGQTRAIVREVALDTAAGAGAPWLWIERRCAGAGQPVELTIIPGGVARPIALLNEPPLLRGRLPADEANILTQAAIFYSLGADGDARAALEPLASAWAGDPAAGDLLWLWGNILLREERWAAAHAAYAAALANPPADPAHHADLLANSALARFFPGRPGAGGADGELCSSQGRADLELALGLEKRATFHILLAKIALYCPRNDTDIEQVAAAEATTALALAPDAPLAHALLAEIGNAIIDDPLAQPERIEQSACRALELAPGLPEALRELGLLFADLGRAGDARAALAAYGRAAVSPWQRQEALNLWLAGADQFPDDASSAVGTLCPDRW